MQYLPPPNADKVLAIGFGTAGCRILAHLERTNLGIDNHVYVSCEKKDIDYASKSKKIFMDSGYTGNRTPSSVRSVAQRHMKEIRKILSDARLVFLVSGLGGCTGSGLAPLISKMAKEEGILTISVIITPFGFEKSKHFYTGIALKKVKENSNAVIIADNDMISSNKAQMSIPEFYSIINKRITTALSGIVESSGELNVGMNRFLDTITNRGYSILSIGTSSSVNKAEEATVRAIESVYSVVEPDEANSAILYLTGDKRITANELETSTSRLNTMLGRGSLEVYQGFNTNGGDTMTAVLLTSGFKSIKFDNYDPLEKILHNHQIDSDMESGIDTELSSLDQIE